MNQNDKNNNPDATGDVISWVIVFVLLFAFPPVGLLLLILKMRSSAKPAAGSARWADAQAAAAARVDAARRASSQQGAASSQYGASSSQQGSTSSQYGASSSQQGTTSSYQSADSVEAAARRAAQEAGNVARQVAQEAGTVARQVAQEVGTAMRKAAQDAGSAMRQAAQEAESATRQAAQKAEPAARQAAQKAEPAARQAAHYSGTVRQAAPGVYYSAPQEYARQQKEKKDKKKNRSQLEKKSGKFLSNILLIVSIAMFIIGASLISAATIDYFGGGQDVLSNLIWSIFYLSGAFVTFFSRNINVKRYGRYKKYYAFAAGRGIVPMSDIARAAGHPARTVARDIQAMINAGHFESGAYIDNELDCLVLSAEAAEEARKEARAAYVDDPAPGVNPENQFMAIMLELREVKSTIADVTISNKVDRIEELTAKIFRIVEDNPEKQTQTRRFMSYYLPTTMKLLRSYSTLEKQGIKGENITAAKENIGRILDTLATGYEQQLDQLFQSDAMDIAADIDVLENLMQQDGLSGEKSEFKMMAEGGGSL